MKAICNLTNSNHFMICTINPYLCKHPSNANFKERNGSNCIPIVYIYAAQKLGKPCWTAPWPWRTTVRGLSCWSIWRSFRWWMTSSATTSPTKTETTRPCPKTQPGRSCSCWRWWPTPPTHCLILSLSGSCTHLLNYWLMNSLLLISLADIFTLAVILRFPAWRRTVRLFWGGTVSWCAQLGKPGRSIVATFMKWIWIMFYWASTQSKTVQNVNNLTDALGLTSQWSTYTHVITTVSLYGVCPWLQVTGSLHRRHAVQRWVHGGPLANASAAPGRGDGEEARAGSGVVPHRASSSGDRPRTALTQVSTGSKGLCHWK